MIDLRALCTKRLDAPAPLPYISRKALKRIKHALPVPTSCNCCNGTSVSLVENSEIYNGRSYGAWPYAYLCRDCRAYIGLHPDTDLPLGTLADKPLREARNRCKRPFEQIWRDGHMPRPEAYAWLALQLGLSAEHCHFGLFDIDRCEQARQVCEQFLHTSAAPYAAYA